MLRPAHAEPEQEAVYSQPKRIAFSHPAYRSSRGGRTLFSLWAWDSNDGGLHHGTALLACMLIACNAANGFLATDQEGRMPVMTGLEEVLPYRPEYFFHVPHPGLPTTSQQMPVVSSLSTSSPRVPVLSLTSSHHSATTHHPPSSPTPSLTTHEPSTPPQATVYKYPVYARFDHWKFPHASDTGLDVDMNPTTTTITTSTNVDREQYTATAAASARLSYLRQWIAPPQPVQTPSMAFAVGTPASSAVTAAVMARDTVCLLTRHGDSLDRAHVCPRSEHVWFHANYMQQYNDSQDLSGDSITDDVANSLLMRCDVHRAFDSARFVLVPKQGQWVAHFLEKTAHYTSQHHNRSLQLPPNVAPQFYLARFAWALFPRTKNFFEGGVPRLVRVESRDSATGEYEETDKVLSLHELQSLLSVGRGRSSSPRKRKTTISSEAPDDHYGPGLSFKCDEPLRQQHTTPTHYSLAVDSAHSPSTPEERAAPLKSPRTGKRRWQMVDTPGRKDEQNEEYERRTRIAALRRSALCEQRPVDPALICCDYTAADRARKSGRRGKEEYGGAHLCMQCQGLEVRQELWTSTTMTLDDYH